MAALEFFNLADFLTSFAEKLVDKKLSLRTGGCQNSFSTTFSSLEEPIKSAIN